ncbi:gamma-mobile-trio protein GmtX [Pseudomonas panipatensis]|uniref:gamma-mobile-trio protein GmtX n=1 Tax=Pseudomonas panipatensis TaxID=428992 RepID=UPI0035B18D72
MNLEQVLENLKNGHSRRVCSSLDSVFVICEEQVKNSNFDFSVATISKLGADRGVPKAQSIRNKTGECYRILIGAFAAAYPKVGVTSRSSSRIEWISEIKDPALKLLVQIQESELSEARKIIREWVPPGLEIYVDDRSFTSGRHRLNSVERRALEYLISDEFLKQFGFQLGGFDDVIDSSGRKVFKPATIAALKKALEFL